MTNFIRSLTSPADEHKLRGSGVGAASSAVAGTAAPLHREDSVADEGGLPDLPLHTLELLRKELDDIDGSLLESLRRRLECCVRIGVHKKFHAIPMMQPHRIGFVQQRAAEFAAKNGLNPSFLHALYVLIIAETCRLEDEVIGAQVPS